MSEPIIVIDPLPVATPLAVTGPDIPALLASLRTDLAVAEYLEIDSPDMLQEALDVAGRLSKAASLIEDERVIKVKPFLDVQRWLNKGYGQARDYLLGIVGDEHGGIKQKIIAFNAAERARVEKAEADARAAQERAALEAAAEAARKLQEAHTLAQQSAAAAESGDAERAQKLADQAVQRTDEAHTTAANAVAAITPHVPRTKVKGVQEKWVADVHNKAEAIQFIGEQIAKGDLTLVGLLDFNQTALNTLAKLQKNAMQIPGITPRPFDSVSIRKQ